MDRPNSCSARFGSPHMRRNGDMDTIVISIGRPRSKRGRPCMVSRQLLTNYLAPPKSIGKSAPLRAPSNGPNEPPNSGAVPVGMSSSTASRSAFPSSSGICWLLASIPPAGGVWLANCGLLTTGLPVSASKYCRSTSSPRTTSISNGGSTLNDCRGRGCCHRRLGLIEEACQKSANSALFSLIAKLFVFATSLSFFIQEFGKRYFVCPIDIRIVRMTRDQADLTQFGRQLDLIRLLGGQQKRDRLGELHGLVPVFGTRHLLIDREDADIMQNGLGNRYVDSQTRIAGHVPLDIHTVTRSKQPGRPGRGANGNRHNTKSLGNVLRGIGALFTRIEQLALEDGLAREDRCSGATVFQIRQLANGTRRNIAAWPLP